MSLVKSALSQVVIAYHNSVTFIAIYGRIYVSVSLWGYRLVLQDFFPQPAYYTSCYAPQGVG